MGVIQAGGTAQVVVEVKDGRAVQPSDKFQIHAMTIAALSEDLNRDGLRQMWGTKSSNVQKITLNCSSQERSTPSTPDESLKRNQNSPRSSSASQASGDDNRSEVSEAETLKLRKQIEQLTTEVKNITAENMKLSVEKAKGNSGSNMFMFVLIAFFAIVCFALGAYFL